jgi:drug/metabolite transporter (DMT)-like permease
MFGSSGFFVRTLTENGIDSTTLLFLRFSIAILVIALAILLTDRELFKIDKSNIPLILVTGICIIGLNLCYNESINTVHLSLAAVLLSTAPIFVLIFAYLLFRERITSRKLICMALAIIGCALMTGVLETSIHNVSTLGILSGVCAALFWAVYLMVSKKLMKNGTHTFTILFYTLIIISICLIPFTNFNEIASFVSIAPTFSIIFLIVHSTFSFALPYILSTISLNYIDSGVSSILLSGAEPVAALILGFSIYSEVPTILMLVGFILTTVSMMMLSRPDNVKN